MSLFLEMLNQILRKTHKKRPGYSRLMSFVYRGGFKTCKLGMSSPVDEEHYWHSLIVISKFILCSLSWYITWRNWLLKFVTKFNITQRYVYNTKMADNFWQQWTCQLCKDCRSPTQVQLQVISSTAGSYLCTWLWQYAPPSPVSASDVNKMVLGAPKRADPVRTAGFTKKYTAQQRHLVTYTGNCPTYILL